MTKVDAQHAEAKRRTAEMADRFEVSGHLARSRGTSSPNIRWLVMLSIVAWATLSVRGLWRLRWLVVATAAAWIAPWPCLVANTARPEATPPACAAILHNISSTLVRSQAPLCNNPPL